MSLRLFDTATRELRDFEPLQPGRVGLYICGLTVQGAPHIGHVRFTVAFDILRRWLTHGHHLEVTLVRNVTDIDDKILAKSQAAGVPWFAWAYAFERQTSAALDALGVLPATYEPRATGHIPEMLELIQTLVDGGYAYPGADDGNGGGEGAGDVYFEVKSWPQYGELTHQKIDDMNPAEDADPRGKRDTRDFALWKGHKSGEPESASWDSPYGRGRPGWHLECSAMARKYLGDTFDIHGGGVDLRFPHHENEQAQSHAAGLGFARYWLHNGWVTVGGEKMSKSLGNSLIVNEVLKSTRPLALRYYLGAAHYRSMIEYTPDSLREAETAVERIEGFLTRAARLGELATTAVPAAFAQAMDDDLNVSGGLAVVHDTVRAGNTALDEGDEATALTAAGAVLAMTDVLGVNPLDPMWHNGSGVDDDRATVALGAMVQVELDARQAARAARDFSTADAIRDRLVAAGIAIEDTPAGARWSLLRSTSDPESES
ncbi:cysteine--tRNA ligase [Angustibacter sp. McL0619]|uniref:cysteine--tRNA ligase n=1 Tax=Angustibacter sp. McL0619 TaxID=3415676 RepID=UPI003CE7B8F1